MNPIQPKTRRWLWTGFALGLLGLILNGIDWWHGSLSFALPKIADQLGVLMLVGALLLTRLSSTLRAWLVMLALVLIVPSTTLMVWRALS